MFLPSLKLSQMKSPSTGLVKRKRKLTGSALTQISSGGWKIPRRVISNSLKLLQLPGQPPVAAFTEQLSNEIKLTLDAATTEYLKLPVREALPLLQQFSGVYVDEPRLGKDNRKRIIHIKPL